MTTDGDWVRHLADHIRETQGIAIRDARKAKGISAMRLAVSLSQLGIETSDAAVSQWETGKTSPRPVTQIAIAQVLGVQWSSLFGLDEVTL